MAHFHSLNFDEQAGAIRRLAATGMSEHGIACATGLAVEQVRRMIGGYSRTFANSREAHASPFDATLQRYATVTQPFPKRFTRIRDDL